MTTKKIGRPTKLTLELQEKICGLIAQGNYINVSCQICGISDDAYNAWLKRGEKGEEPFKGFAVAIKRAEVDAEAERIARIEQAGKGGAVTRRRIETRRDGTEVVDEQYTAPAWQADMTLLERRHPERWGRRVKVGGDTDAPIPVEVKVIKIVEV